MNFGKGDNTSFPVRYRRMTWPEFEVVRDAVVARLERERSTATAEEAHAVLLAALKCDCCEKPAEWIDVLREREPEPGDRYVRCERLPDGPRIACARKDHGARA